MKVYLYLDIYILLNFIMNLFLLMITAMIRQKRCRIFRLFLVSFAVSLISATVTYLLWGNLGWQIILAVVQISALIFFAFAYEGWRSLIGDLVTFVFLSVFAGGCIGVFLNLLYAQKVVPEGYSLGWVLVAVIVLFILFFLFRWEIIRSQTRRDNVLSVRLSYKGKEYCVRALYDTGNQLVSPYTGEGVAVISKKLSEEMHLEKEQNPLLIPYASVGGTGLLKAYRMDAIHLSNGKIRKNALVAVSENLNAGSEIQMILNII